MHCTPVVFFLVLLDTQYVADRYGLLTARTPSFKRKHAVVNISTISIIILVFILDGEEKLFAFTGITPPRHLCKGKFVR